MYLCCSFSKDKWMMLNVITGFSHWAKFTRECFSLQSDIMWNRKCSDTKRAIKRLVIFFLFFKAKLDISTDNIASFVIPFSVVVHICFFHFNVSFCLAKEFGTRVYGCTLLLDSLKTCNLILALRYLSFLPPSFVLAI